MRADILFRTVLFVVMNGALAFACYLLAQRLLPSARISARLAASAVLFVGVIVVLAQVLSSFGLYTFAAALTAAALLAVAARTLLGGQSQLSADCAAVRAALSDVARSRGAVLLVISFVAFALVARRALAHPPLGWDSLTYHLVFSAKYVQAGSLVTFYGPTAMDHYAYFPKNGEILASWLMLPFSSDLLVGIMNLSLILVAWLATYGVGRELELKQNDAALAATAVCASPFIFSYVATSNPDTLVYAMLLCAVLFMARYVKHRQHIDALLTCAGVGLAVGTKYTALPFGGLLLCGVVVASSITLFRLGAFPTLGVLLLGCLAILVAFGARQYVLNTMSTGNPIYPMTIGGDFLRSSPYTDQLERDKGSGDRRRDLLQIIQTFNYFPDWRIPTSAGPKFLVLIPLALLGLVRPMGGSPWLLRMLILTALIGMVVAYLPANGFAALSRRFWPGSTPRFLAASFGILTVAGLVVASGFQHRLYEVVRGAIVAFVVWDFLIADTSLPGMMPVLVGVAAFAFLLVPLLTQRLPQFRVLLPVMVIGLLVLAVPLLNDRRVATRWRDYAKATDIHDFPREFVRGWQYCDQLAPNSKIALAAGWSNAGQNYFFYPLMGSRLQNSVTYVPIDPSAPPQSLAYVRRDSGEPSEWIGEIRNQRVTHVFVQSPWPTEDTWMRENPESFSMIMSDEGFRLYQVQGL